LSRECQNPQKEKSCYQCGKTGHISRECPEGGAPGGGQVGGGYGGGPGAGGQECYKCGKVGHIARNCQQGGGYGAGAGGYGGGYGGAQGGYGGGRVQTCYSCGGFGHMSRDCTQGQKCYNCEFTILSWSGDGEERLLLTLRLLGGEVGHLSRDCPSESSSERVCYKCKQPGHVQAACPN